MKPVLFVAGFLFSLLFFYIFSDALYNQLWGPGACVSKDEKEEVIRSVFSSVYCTANAEEAALKLSYKDKFRADTINYQLLKKFNSFFKKNRIVYIKLINDFLIRRQLDTAQTRQYLGDNASTALLNRKSASLCICTVFRQLNIINDKVNASRSMGAAAISMPIPISGNKLLCYYELGGAANMNTGFVIFQVENRKVKTLYQESLTIN